MMEYKNYRSEDVRIVYSSPLSSAPYQELAYEFINKIFREFAKLSLNYYNPAMGLNQMPLYYSERRFDSVILPVLSKLCDGLVLTELPVRRSKDDSSFNGKGRVDYWCIYKGYSFIIEMKQTFDRIDCNKVRKHSMIERWQKMYEQLQTARPSARHFEEQTEGVIPIGLHFVTSRSYDDLSEEYCRSCVRNCRRTMDYFVSELANPKMGKKVAPDYAASWNVPEEIAMSRKDEGVIYPHVLLFAQIRPVISIR